ncbi:MAG: hypothetical protein JRE18_00705, partial [Deltaproteobacteria bacterium]|nr:hypothetical protein [Deltaproteobacteria bacterium]
HSIAGILATIGTGIDQQIIVIDEAQQKEALNIKQKLKRAFAIIHYSINETSQYSPTNNDRSTTT